MTDEQPCEVCQGTGQQPPDWGSPPEECSYCEGTGVAR